MDYNSIIKQAKEDSNLKDLNNQIHSLRKKGFVEMTQFERDDLGFIFKEVENYVQSKYKASLSDIQKHPEEFLYELFGK